MNVTVSPSEAITLITSFGRSTAAPIDSKSSASTNGTHAVGAGDPTAVVGDTEGEAEGDEVGAELGAFDGEALGVFEGAKVGPTEGGMVGESLRVFEGEVLGDADGEALGAPVGEELSPIVGAELGGPRLTTALSVCKKGLLEVFAKKSGTETG